MIILRKLFKKKVFYIIFIALFITLILFTARQSRYTPIQIVKQRFQGEAPCFSVRKLIKQIELDKEQVLLFYYNNNNNISYALLEKRLFGYKLLDAGGELSVQSTTRPAGMQFGFYNQEAGWVGCGVVYNDSVSKIIIDNYNVNIINVENLRLWYLVGTEKIDIYNTKIIDYNGNELIH